MVLMGFVFLWGWFCIDFITFIWGHFELTFNPSNVGHKGRGLGEEIEKKKERVFGCCSG